jgi:hypothetical protein
MGIKVATVPPEAQLMPQDNSRQAPASSRQSEQSSANDQAPRDNQQIQEDNQTSGTSVNRRQSPGDAIGGEQDVPNQASNKEKAEGSRASAGEDAGGISNRPLSEEEARQENLPPRGEAKDGSHA